MDRDLAAKVFPIFQRLGNKQLLKRCETQNPNESIHNMFWPLVSKRTFSSARDVKISAARAAAKLSAGAQTLGRVISKLGGKWGGGESQVPSQESSLKGRTKSAKPENPKWLEKKKERLDLSVLIGWKLRKESHMLLVLLTESVLYFHLCFFFFCVFLNFSCSNCLFTATMRVL